jgi:predicted site-specific integrase-resolvase
VTSKQSLEITLAKPASWDEFQEKAETMRIGYARVSSQDQNPDLQLDALRAAGCKRIFVETASGAQRDRPELARRAITCGRATRWSSGSWTGWRVR